MMISDLIAAPSAQSQPPPLQRHILTSEYPPQPGGVSDYTAHVAAGLAEMGEEVHVWSPGPASLSVTPEGVHVHRAMGSFMPSDLKRAGAELDRFPEPRRILVQYVPHGYGRRSMNVPFCNWLLDRARRGDVIDLMAHEAFLTFEGSWRQYGAAAVHRLMAAILLRAATRVWVSNREGERRLRPYIFGRDVPFEWLPVPSNVPVIQDFAASEAIRRQYVPAGGLLLGHFGTYGAPVLTVLEPVLARIAEVNPDQPLVLMGRGSLEFRARILERNPAWDRNLHATGPLAPQDLSLHLAACDLLVQPYPDGATTRRGSLMAGISHGKPILTTRGVVTESIWEQSRGVALAPAGDTDAFLALLRQLLRDPAERARLAQAGRQLYHDRFDISRTVAAFHAAALPSVPCAS